MKKNYVYLFSVLSALISQTNAQENQKMQPKKEYQKTLRLNHRTTRESAISEIAKVYGLDKNNRYELKSETSDISGLTHQRLQQYYKGIKVEFGTIITHSKDGAVESVNAELYNANL